MTAYFVYQALQMALWRRKMPKGVILRSDRGSQYCFTAYQNLMVQHQLVCSMSAQGNCYNNACAERFFHTMKVETIHGERFATCEEMGHTVFEYIDVDYNRTRRHGANGRFNPMAFEALKTAQLDVHSTRAGSINEVTKILGNSQLKTIQRHALLSQEPYWRQSIRQPRPPDWTGHKRTPPTQCMFRQSGAEAHPTDLIAKFSFMAISPERYHI